MAEREQNLTCSSARNKTWNTYSGSTLAPFPLQPVKTIFVLHSQNILCLQHMLPFAQNSTCEHVALRCKSGMWVWFSVRVILSFCAIACKRALIYPWWTGKWGRQLTYDLHLMRWGLFAINRPATVTEVILMISKATVYYVRTADWIKTTLVSHRWEKKSHFHPFHLFRFRLFPGLLGIL